MTQMSTMFILLLQGMGWCGLKSKTQGGFDVGELKNTEYLACIIGFPYLKKKITSSKYYAIKCLKL